jgi:signal transduction histidine kinase
MRIDGARSVRSLAMMIAVLALLPVLAVLQYRWIGQVSEAERDHMQASLREATMRMSEEFDDEIRHAFGMLQSGPDQNPLAYSDAYAKWSATARHPGLIRNFYLTRIGDTVLLKLNRSDGRFEPSDWPAELTPLRERLESAQPPRSPRPPGPFPGEAEEEIPVLAAPRMRPPERPGLPPEVDGWTIIELDLPFIQNELLPALARKYFAQSGELDYQLQVVAREGRVIYQTDPRLPRNFFSSVDATAGMLETRPGPPGRPGGGRWQLRVRHRLGSLEAVVERARRRNLAINVVVFALMAASIAMLVRSTERAQRLARLQMEFVAGVSHELRTPLTVIRSAADNLADGLIDNQQQARRYGGVIRNEARRLSEMVEQILGFAGMQDRKLKLELEPAQIEEIVGRAVAAFAETGCEIEEHIDDNLPPVMANVTSLTQCVRNLLSNALKYGDGGKWIGVRAKAAGREVEVSVEDKGPGIDPADLPHLFEPFYRGRKAVAGQIHGTGLGLSLVKRIMDAHAGTVTVTSRPGQGACFTLHLPAKEVFEDGTENSAG